MILNTLSDNDLLTSTKRLAQDERERLTKVLGHLREIDRRKLYCDLGYQSLFDYAVKDLRYSEGQAGRRIQAMRLIKEIPEVEKKIASGDLNLTNVSRAQSFFREVRRTQPAALKKSEKIAIIKKLENKTSREGELEIMKISPPEFIPRDRERIITEDHTEIKFVMNKELKTKLEKVRALAGPKGATMNFGELVDFMAQISLQSLENKKFGKRKMESLSTKTSITPAPEFKLPKNPRYIPRPIWRFVMQRDKRQCVNCACKKNLNIDHIIPVARGGRTEPKNLRVLCFNCNQRAGMKAFGVEFMEGKRLRSEKNPRAADPDNATVLN